MLLLNKEDIRSVFSMKDAIETDKECYRLFNEGKFDVPLRAVISGTHGNFLFMPAYCEDMGAAGLKIVNIMPGNTAKGLPASIGQVLLIDGETGVVKALMDGTYVTALRTAAASGAAFDLFGRKDAEIGAVIGTGSQFLTVGIGNGYLVLKLFFLFANTLSAAVMFSSPISEVTMENSLLRVPV